MASLTDFDTTALDAIVDKFGVKQAWTNILGTSILDRPEQQYIFSDPDFMDFQPLSTDLIHGLSIGEISVLYEYCVARHDQDSRKANGQYFTPDDVARFMVSKSKEFPEGKWFDPCSGIGNLSWHLVDAQENKEEFLVNSLILSDKDEVALFIARFLLATHFQSKRKNLFTDIRSNFIVFDFLSVADGGCDELFSFNPLEAIPAHNFVIVNPPYLHIKGPDFRFETAKATDLYAYFLENVIKSSEGYISVTPQSFTNAMKFETLRSLILKKYSNIRIYNFDNIPGNIFYGIKFGSRNSNTANSMRAAITVAIPGPGQPQISSLFRWRTSERRQMFETIDKFLACPPLSSEYFPKVSAIFEDLYVELMNVPRLSALLANSPTIHALHIPSAPRYFISALKIPVSRASQKTIYFHDQKQLNRAYLLLNSSLMYWWWRVRDGGMTLSLETIMSAPLPEFKPNPRLVAQLLASEAENKVYKRNAGANQENIKHPRDLIIKLNKWIVPQYSQELILTHENSELSQLGLLKISFDNS